MRDNHSFRRVPLQTAEDLENAIRIVREEFDDGHSHGMLCSKHPKLERDSVHGRGNWETFEPQAIEWLNRAFRLLHEPEPPSVSLPKTEDEATLMVLLGTQWLEKNAPHRLTPSTTAPEPTSHEGLISAGLKYVGQVIDLNSPTLDRIAFDGRLGPVIWVTSVEDTPGVLYLLPKVKPPAP